jgi:hypothetical protein
VPIVQGYDDCVDEREGDDREDREVKMRRYESRGKREWDISGSVGEWRTRETGRKDAREVLWCWGCR